MRFKILLRLSGCENFSGPSRNGPLVEVFVFPCWKKKTYLPQCLPSTDYPYTTAESHLEKKQCCYPLLTSTGTAERSEYVFLGAFHSMKNSGLIFWKFPATNGTAFSGICRKGDNLAGNFRSILPSYLNFRDFRLNGSLSRNSTISRFSIPWNFLTVCPQFEIFVLFAWMESAPYSC